MMPSAREREPWGKNGMRKTRNTNATAHRPASILRDANRPRTNTPNHPMRWVVNSLASDGVRIRKMAEGATYPYPSMNRLTVESTWSTSVCEKLAIQMPEMRPPMTSTSRYFSNQLTGLSAAFDSMTPDPVEPGSMPSNSSSSVLVDCKLAPSSIWCFAVTAAF